MPVKTTVKICVDMGMTVMLLFLMAYEMIGQAAHEWLGIGIFVLDEKRIGDCAMWACLLFMLGKY